MQLIHNDTVDTFALTVKGDDERRRFFDFSEPVYYSISKVLINVPSQSWHKYMAFFESYQFTLWVAILIALMLQCALSVIFNRVEVKINKNEKKKRISDLVWQIVRLQLMQPEDVNCNITAGRISVFIFAFIQCTVIMGVLSSYIFSNLVRKQDPIPYKTFSQFASLIADGTLHMVEVTKANIFYETIYKSNAADYVELRHALDKNPIKLAKNIEELLVFLDEPGAVLVRYVSIIGL
ncbi:unnamed protein product [Bursaphelenchus okinawaensis]|uniref:Ionotropic glutamate receptor C-terminal domain-containing protein n=1 Tax=Bursaphelenchus okinawaensis TaxID=465554 RepID=A0A811K327_9BILA|nr:unnamed protein product [Bursaphelenchus okinawaensis]CAG9089561.1 unnamed protein product [Bursaphelenchus okinawaensis]